MYLVLFFTFFIRILGVLFLDCHTFSLTAPFFKKWQRLQKKVALYNV